MNEPLKGKRFGLLDHHTKQVIETNYQDNALMKVKRIKMNEQLKDKRGVAFDMVGVHPISTEYNKGGNLFVDDDIKSAVEWLKVKILSDGVYEIELKGTPSAGLVDVKKVFNNIEKAFEDVTLSNKGDKK